MPRLLAYWCAANAAALALCGLFVRIGDAWGVIGALVLVVLASIAGNALYAFYVLAPGRGARSARRVRFRVDECLCGARHSASWRGNA